MTDHEKLKLAISLLEIVFVDLSTLVDLINDDDNQVWEQPKKTCLLIDLAAMEIRNKLETLNDKIRSLTDD